MASCIRVVSLVVGSLAAACGGGDVVTTTGSSTGTSSTVEGMPGTSEPTEPTGWTSGPSSVSTSEATSGGATTQVGDPSTTADDSSGNGSFGLPEPQAYCGDGVVNHASEKCDHGSANDNHGICTKYCNYAVCGDGLVHTLDEACPVDADGCSDELEECDDGDENCGMDSVCCNCRLDEQCGDGLVQMGEQCDDGIEQPVGGAECHSCRFNGLQVFITKAEFHGALFAADALDAADVLCQQTALAQNLVNASEFRAWISIPGVEGGSPSSRFKRKSETYVVVGDGVGWIVAPNFMALSAGPIHRINYDESGQMVGDNVPVWTGTLSDGTPAESGQDCNAWISEDGYGLSGRVHVDGFPKAWTEAASFSCKTPAHLYCFEDWVP